MWPVAACVIWPRFYFRLIDDGFFIWEHGQDTLQPFLTLLSTLLPNIQLTFQQHQHKLPYLDVWISKDMAAAGPLVPLLFTTHQKSHSKYLYIPYQSHHRPHVFRAFIRGELIRYAVTNTRQSDFQHMADLFWQRLVIRGYPPRFLQPIFAGVTHDARIRYLQQPSHQQQQRQQRHAPPVFVAVNDQHAHMRMNLGKVINDVYQQYVHVPELREIFGDRVVVAYRNPPNLGKLLVKANH